MTDETHSETDDDELIEKVTMIDWKVLSNPFYDTIPRGILKHYSEYDFHPAVDRLKCKDTGNVL